MIDLIFCGGNNPTFARIAIEAGYYYGAQLPSTTYGRLYFADQDWKNPNRKVYMAALRKHKPFMASVIDWEEESRLSEVLDWAEEAAQYVTVVLKVTVALNFNAFFLVTRLL